MDLCDVPNDEQREHVGGPAADVQLGTCRGEGGHNKNEITSAGRDIKIFWEIRSDAAV